ncbi:MAG: DUF86 domain-containing protein [Clostridiales bacterium]|nr:DUF86 domain-containing protein [Clostridiales bacterium]
MKKGTKDLSIISHILEYCAEIEETVSRFGDDYDCFSSDKIYRNAVTMCILQIGELAGKLSKGFVEANSEIPWRSIKAMRNVAAHAYGSISIPDIWDTIKNDIPGLRSYCIKILK